jgi:hypothetical protein
MSKFYPPNTPTAIRTANTPAKGELIFDTDLDKLFLGDGITIGGLEVGGTTTGDMLKSIYDTDNDGVVDLAESISGSPTSSQYYGTNSTGTKGFYNLPTGTNLDVVQGATTLEGATALNFTGTGVTVTIDGTTANIAISTSAGDMLKSVYDTNNDGVIDSAESIAGTPGTSKYYGTNNVGTKGFYDLPSTTSSNDLTIAYLVAASIS